MPPPVIVEPAPAERWVFLTADSRSFKLDQPATVRFGDDRGGYLYRDLPVGVAICSGNEFGGNPGSPYYQHCDVKVVTPMTDWEFISYQTGTFAMQADGYWRKGTAGDIEFAEGGAKKGDLIDCDKPHCWWLAKAVPEKTVNPFRNMSLMQGMPVVAQGFVDPSPPIYYGERIRPYTDADFHGSDGVNGSFRNGCLHTKFLYDDPVAAFGKPGTTHLHEFCGAGGVDADFVPTPECPGGSSTPGGVVNCSEYHWPAVINRRTGQPVAAFASNNYYKTSFTPGQRQGLRWPDYGTAMIFGNQPLNTQAVQLPGWNFVITCSEIPGDWTYIPPACPEGAEVTVGLNAPDCWNGQKDSIDHRSHFAYSWQFDGCPSSHPIYIVQLRVNLHFHIPKGATGKDLRCSSDLDTDTAGCKSFHVDWLNGWKPAHAQMIVDGLKVPMDLGQGGLYDKVAGRVTEVLY
ncbi:MAG: DUF1996 domain-containing protein [Steroidobacteraceae bacterium]